MFRNFLCFISQPLLIYTKVNKHSKLTFTLIRTVEVQFQQFQMYLKLEKEILLKVGKRNLTLIKVPNKLLHFSCKTVSIIQVQNRITLTRILLMTLIDIGTFCGLPLNMNDWQSYSTLGTHAIHEDSCASLHYFR